MKINRTALLAAILVISALVSSAAILAQDATPESTAVPSSFTDGRINGDIQLGGLAVYCADVNGDTHANSFQGGSLQVWGADGQEYIVLTDAELSGEDEIMQPPPTMEAGATQEPMMTPVAGATEVASPTNPSLLARAAGPNGEIWLLKIGDNQFVLQTNDEHGKFITYTWEGCGLGNIQTDVVPLLPSVQGTPMMATTAEATAEATASS